MPVKRQTLKDFIFATILLPALGAFAWHYRIEWLLWAAGFFSLGVLLGLVGKEYGLRKKAIANTYLLLAIAAIAGAYYLLGNILNSLSAGVIVAAALLNIHAYIKSYQRYRAWQNTRQQPAQETEELLEEIKEGYQFDLSALSTKRGLLNFVQSEEPITEAVTKFGGQPVWLDKPQWPISRKLGKPMHFIGQVALDPELFGNKQARMAYIFYSGYEEIDNTSDFDGGENAVILQPGCEPLVPVIDQAEGPVLEFESDKDRRCEFAVKLETGEDPAFVRDYELGELAETQRSDLEKAASKNKIGGTPWFYQYDEFPDDQPWQLLCQLDDFTVPFYVNFGTGMAYMFINQEGTKAKMMWQC